MPAISTPNAELPVAQEVVDAAARAQALPWRLPVVLSGMLAGAALQLQQPVLWSVATYAVLLMAALAVGGCVVALGRKMRRRSVAKPRFVGGLATALALTAALTGAAGAAGAMAVFATNGLRASAYAAKALVPSLEGQDIRVVGVVAAMPQVNEAGTRLRIAVEAAQLRGEPVQLPALIDVTWYSGSFRDTEDAQDDALRQVPIVTAGDRWSLTARLKAPHGLRNPYGFDYELWMWEQGLQATGAVRAGPKDEPPVRMAATWQYPMEQLRQTVRDRIFARLGRTSDDTDPSRAGIAGVVAALVTGDQRAIDRADWDVFRATGVAHLMSISGLHITLFAWLAAWCTGMLWRRSTRLCLWVPAPSAALVAGVLLAAGYAVFSGWGVPAQRTVLMLATVALLQGSGRRWPWPHVWLLVCAAVVLVDPWALAQAGFWLSFVAVGVLFATNPIANKAYKSSARGHFYALFREQWVVTLALTPLSLLLFGQVSVVGFVANLVAIPWVTLVVTPLALGGVVYAPLWSLAALSLQPLTGALQWLAQWPWAVVFLPTAPLWAGMAGVLGGALLAMRLPWRLRLPAFVLLVPVVFWSPARPGAGDFELLAADIGQGNAVLVRTASHTLLYDAGPQFSRESDAGHRVLVPLLRALGERVDTLMLSHRDADHTGGAQAVLKQQPQASLTGSIEPTHALQRVRPVTPCLAGQKWEWDGVVFEVLHPLPGADAPQLRAKRPPREPRPNTLSCVLRIAAQGGAGATALLVGDIETPQEQALLARSAPVKANLLLVPHHGSKTSSSRAFLEAVQPDTALVQAGYRNRFGHPAPDVLQRYRALGINVVESAHCGAANWSSKLPAAVVCERDSERHYWQHQLAPRDG